MDKVTLYGSEHFPIPDDCSEVFSWLSCTDMLPCFPTFSAVWSTAVDALRDRVRPLAVVVREAGMLTVWITLGQQADALILEAFHAGDYIRALLLNTLADRVLFRMDETVVRLVREQLRAEDMFIGARLEPAVDFDLTAEHIASVHAVLPEAGLSSAHSLTPSKSMLFCLTLAPHDCMTTGLHDCSRCSQQLCPYRGAKGRTIG
ncbi:MAG TPA: hypothetical protein PLA31_00230 [Clostridia bacterium]|nr:hypothetical protein [Clostridia bacterium]